MKRLIKHGALVLCAALACGAAQAQGQATTSASSYEDAGPSLTRAQVLEELEIAKTNGLFAALNSEDSSEVTRWQQNMTSEPAKTRAEVKDELRQAQASGELRLYNSEDPADQLRLDTRRPTLIAG
ncbi:DUF4148 domain-containing protein [Paucibacter sp. R3-3]|uniref:DUF4148 domain-containing protein n=1 Tax=Roseateles agri TaxID=3098619 RepID=A0ABU5DJY2_9BURK|nr:DUF4148 domain-containing protein [Paucibacter sp. R3-3]MDY0745407.1 DUF4148 domain-containing protein [Paucibacter sp. R3-3]